MLNNRKILLILLILLVVIFIGSVVFKKKPYYLCENCNVILISATNLRYDHMSSTGYFRPTTPNLDKWASESINFTNFFAHASWTLPAGLSLFSSLYPFNHGVMNRYDGSKLGKDTKTLIDVLNENGYKTAAFTGGADYLPKYGLTDRFTTHEECVIENNSTLVIPPLIYGEFSCSLPKAINWLKKNSTNKFFLFLQGYDLHCPFNKHELDIYDNTYKGETDFSGCIWSFDEVKPSFKDGKSYYSVYDSKDIQVGQKKILIDDRDIFHLKALYDEQITSTDRLLGEFLGQMKKMGLDKNTIFIFTSEHGDIFGKHGRFMRGGPLHGTFYDDVLHIPLLIRNPKLVGAKIDSLAQQIDVIPTILDFLGLKSIKKIDGKSLIPTLFGYEVNAYTFAGSEFSPGPTNLFYNKKTIIESIRNKQWKLIQERALGANPSVNQVELYNIQDDKEELKDMSVKRKDILKLLLSKLQIWFTKLEKK